MSKSLTWKKKPTKKEIIKAIEKLAYYHSELNIVKGEYWKCDRVAFETLARLLNFIDGKKEDRLQTKEQYFGGNLNEKETKKIIRKARKELREIRKK